VLALGPIQYGNISLPELWKIIYKFSKRTIAEHFDIPESNVNGFLTYCLSQPDFNALSSSANMAEIWAYLETKSVVFKRNDFSEE
jgi:hypothetical protein